MRTILISFFIFISSISLACECIPLSPISKELSNNYDVIFYGRVDSIGACGDKSTAIAYFSITELYKGNVQKQVKINFDCNTECMMSFAADDEWIIYAKYSKFDFLNISICDHNRKKFNAGEEDIYLIDSKRTFEKELEFLKSTLALQETVEPTVVNNTVTEIGRHNEQPSSWGKITLLLISVIAMVVVYFVTRKKK